MGTEGTAIDVDLVAASLRSGSGDTGAFVERLAHKLEDTLPSGVKVQRGRHGLLGPKRVKAIAVDAADLRFELVQDDAGRIETRRARMSRGIVLKTEVLGTDSWLDALVQALADEAGQNERTRQALERLLLT